MGTHFSRDASCFTLMRGNSSSGFRVASLCCLTLTLISAPHLSWATDLKANQNTVNHRLMDNQKIQDLKMRIAELKEKVQKEHHHNGGGTPTGTLEGLQAKVTALETTVATLVSADNTVLTTLQAAQTQIATLQARIATLESKPTSGGGIPGLDKYVSIDPNPINGVNGPHVIFSGANVHVRSGSGATDDNGSPTGLGNLILGYDEPDPSVQLPRNGSHNLVAGTMNSFSTFGGAVLGFRNRLTGQYASVLGGDSNIASGVASTVLGGSQGTASGAYATILGGSANLATTQFYIAPAP
jgi:hypothetical protein